MTIQDFEDWSTRVYWDYYFTILQDTPESYDGAAKKSVIVNDTETGLNYSNADVDDHSARHEEGAADEITGITGKLNNHSSRHEEGAADEITEITGKLNNHSTRHENGGADEISVAGLSGVLADKQDPQDHGSSHKDGGADELDATDLAGAAGTADQVLTTNGAAAYWGDAPGGVSSGRDLPTSSGSTSGNTADGTYVDITLNDYSFFPMVYGRWNEFDMIGHSTEGAYYQPRFALYSRGGFYYAVKWRYFT